MLDELTGEIMIPTYKLKLCDGLAKVVGRKYAGRSELTREVMLDYLTSVGAVKKVLLVRVAVEPMDGREFEAVIDKEASTVKDLKRAITEAHGVSSCKQDLFLLKRGADQTEETNPMSDTDTVEDGDHVSLRISGQLMRCSSSSPPHLSP